MPARTETAVPGKVRGRLVRDAAMARYCSWRVGGKADLLFFPEDAGDLASFVSSTPGTPMHFVGLGSNLLVRDAGVRGAVVRLAPGLAKVEMADAGQVRAEAGVAMPKLAKFAAKNGLGKAGFMAGIPGSVGGALAMNAGCFGSSTWDLVSKVEFLDRQGNLREAAPDMFEVGYRYVRHGLDGLACYLAATFAMPPREPGEEEKDREMMATRESTQPIGTPNAGSTFVNPEGDSAGRLIDGAGLAGERVGGAVVSDKHANFIVNDGTATAADIEGLIDRVQRAVFEKTGVRLRPEVRIIGEAS